MNILTLVHHDDVGPSLFGEVIRKQGHQLDVHSFSQGAPAQLPTDYAAVLVCGGPMNVDQDGKFPWLAAERQFLRQLIAHDVPTLGLCLGAQLLAHAVGAAVFDASESEIGWYEVETTPDAANDPVFGAMPPRFHAFQWHSQTHALPAGATVLARGRVGIQAYHRPPYTWGVQFHPELTHTKILHWLAHAGWESPTNAAAIARETGERIEAWNQCGEALCTAFLTVAANR